MIEVKNHYTLSIGTEIISNDGQCLRSYRKMVLNGLEKHLNLMKIS